MDIIKKSIEFILINPNFNNVLFRFRINCNKISRVQMPIKSKNNKINPNYK
jgi:hypothetical protein